MLQYTKIDADGRGWHIEFEVSVTENNFKEVCQVAIDLAKNECAAQNTVAINFVAMGIDVQVAEADTPETQFALWKPKADGYNAIRNDLAKSWESQYLDRKGLPLPEPHRHSRMNETMKPGEWGTRDGKPSIAWYRPGIAVRGEPSVVQEVRTYANEKERFDAHQAGHGTSSKVDGK